MLFTKLKCSMNHSDLGVNSFRLIFIFETTIILGIEKPLNNLNTEMCENIYIKTKKGLWQRYQILVNSTITPFG